MATYTVYYILGFRESVHYSQRSTLMKQPHHCSLQVKNNIWNACELNSPIFGEVI